MDIFILFILCLGCFYAGWILKTFILLSKMADDPDHFINMLKAIKEINDTHDDLPEEVKANGIELAIERVGEMLYAYAKENRQFIAQGSDLKTVLESAHKRFPGKIFFGNIPADDPAKELA